MIKESAIKRANKIYTGKSHTEILKAHISEGTFSKNDYTLGFVTDSGEFVTRMQAAKIAYEYGQIKEKMSILFSTDINE